MGLVVKVKYVPRAPPTLNVSGYFQQIESVSSATKVKF